MHYIHRSIEPLLKEALGQFPAVLVSGPRQAGKSTLLQHVLKNYTYVTLDDPMMRAMAIQDPELFLSAHPEPLIIDEIQYAPELFSYLKMKIDAKRQAYGRFVLTGSQIFQLMKGVSESLAGRIAIFQLYPLSWKEIQEDPKDDRLCVKQMIQGFYPQFFSEPNTNWNLWFSSYVATYLERDVRNLKSIVDLSRFQMFLSLLAARAGQLVNMAEISKECGVSQPTIKDWLAILEATYVIFLLRPFHKNRSKRLVKTPKVFFIDTGLLCYLLGIDTQERFLKSAEKGHIFENMVIAEFLKRSSIRSQRTELFFYRTHNQVEVDLIVETRGEVFAYEIKFAKTLSKQMADPIHSLMEDVSIAKASVLSLSEKSTLLASKVHAEHWSTILKEPTSLLHLGHT